MKIVSYKTILRKKLDDPEQAAVHLTASTLHSCRIENEVAPLLARQAKRKRLTLAELSSLYLREKTLEEEFPGIGFRDAIGGREAYVLGSRAALWEVLDVCREAKSVAKTADHFGWPDHLVKCARAYAKAFPGELATQREAEVGVRTRHRNRADRTSRI